MCEVHEKPGFLVVSTHGARHKVVPSVASGQNLQFLCPDRTKKRKIISSKVLVSRKGRTEKKNKYLPLAPA